MSTVLVAVIHHGEFAHAPVSDVVQRLIKMCPQWVVEELVEQAPIVEAPDKAELVTWAQTQWSLEKSWRIHRGVQSWWRQAAADLGHFVWRTRLRLSGRFRGHAWHVRQVEARVTSKHVDAWRSLLESDASSVVILESDAAWISDRSETLRDAVGALPSETPGYMNLAGGLSDFRIRIAGLSVSDVHRTQDSAPQFLDFAIPVTNTSCAYVINRPLASFLLDYLERHPGMRGLGVDWLINAAFIEMSNLELDVMCCHADPPILVHGSLAGITQSWHPGR